MSAELLKDGEYTARKNEWESRSVAVPMNKEDYERKSSEIASVLEELATAEIEKAEIAAKLKRVKERMESLASQIASKTIAKKVPTMWLYNEERKIKRMIARLEDGSVFDVCDEPMMPEDFQMQIGDKNYA